MSNARENNFNGTTATCNSSSPVSLELLAAMSDEVRKDFLAQVRAVAALHGVIIIPSLMVGDNQMMVTVSQRIYDELCEGPKDE